VRQCTLATLLGRVAFAWGIAGVLLLLGQALLRLIPLAWGAVTSDLSTLQWAVLAVWVVVMAHAEGYRGFHLRFSPRVVARALWLADNARPGLAVAAPVFCMSLFGASKKGMLVSRLLVVGIFGLVMAVRTLPQPWRGIIDAGVVAGLGIGTASILWHVARALGGTPPPMPPDLPDPADQSAASNP